MDAIPKTTSILSFKILNIWVCYYRWVNLLAKVALPIKLQKLANIHPKQMCFLVRQWDWSLILAMILMSTSSKPQHPTAPIPNKLVLRIDKLAIIPKMRLLKLGYVWKLWFRLSSFCFYWLLMHSGCRRVKNLRAIRHPISKLFFIRHGVCTWIIYEWDYHQLQELARKK